MPIVAGPRRESDKKHVTSRPLQTMTLFRKLIFPNPGKFEVLGVPFNNVKNTHDLGLRCFNWSKCYVRAP